MIQTQRGNKEQIQKLALLAYQALEDKKAEDLSLIDIGDISVIGDYFLLASGTNIKHLEALTDVISDTLAAENVFAGHIEGIPESGWVLMDYGDFIVHIFSKEARSFYDIDRNWRDGTLVYPKS